MTDVFISYASEDRGLAGQLAGLLGKTGWSIWWDRNIVPGQAFDLTIEHELETAKSVVVLWSKHSIASEWVRNEASVASERGVLVPVMIDPVKLPIEFRRKQTAELFDWKGNPSHPGFHSLCDGIAAKIGGMPPEQPASPQGRKFFLSTRWLLVTFAAIAFAVALGFYTSGSRQSPELNRVSDHSSAANPSRSSTQLITGPSTLLVAAPEPADLVVGTYSGEVISDLKGSSRSDVSVTITRLDQSTVRVTSDYSRLATQVLKITRIGNRIVNEGGDTPFIVDLDLNPYSLEFNPHNEVAFSGKKQE